MTPRLPGDPPTTFSDFVGSDEMEWEEFPGWYRREVEKFRRRLARADIKSLPALVVWTRLRYPDWFYERDHRRRDGTGAPSKVMLQELWAAYLEWVEL